MRKANWFQGAEDDRYKGTDIMNEDGEFIPPYVDKFKKPELDASEILLVVFLTCMNIFSGMWWWVFR